MQMLIPEESQRLIDLACGTPEQMYLALQIHSGVQDSFFARAICDAFYCIREGDRDFKHDEFLESDIDKQARMLYHVRKQIIIYLYHAPITLRLFERLYSVDIVKESAVKDLEFTRGANIERLTIHKHNDIRDLSPLTAINAKEFYLTVHNGNFKEIPKGLRGSVYFRSCKALDDSTIQNLEFSQDRYFQRLDFTDSNLRNIEGLVEIVCKAISNNIGLLIVLRGTEIGSSYYLFSKFIDSVCQRNRPVDKVIVRIRIEVGAKQHQFENIIYNIDGGRSIFTISCYDL